jgi:hypothetical protein
MVVMQTRPKVFFGTFLYLKEVFAWMGLLIQSMDSMSQLTLKIVALVTG